MPLPYGRRIRFPFPFLGTTAPPYILSEALEEDIMEILIIFCLVVEDTTTGWRWTG
jgi:hypothetical protein